jgi:hypothetical protein
MGRKLRKQLQCTSGQMRVFITILFCLLTTAFMTLEAAASVDIVTNWPVTPTIVSNSNASPVTGKFSVGLGNNRLMLVTIASEYSTAQAPTFTVTYGGQTVTMIQNNTTGNNKIWIGYLNEAGIVAAGANKILSVTPSITTNLTAIYATAAVFAGVDQTTPISGSNSLGTSTGATTIGPVAFTSGNANSIAGNNGLSVYLVNWNTTSSTPSAGYTELRDYNGTNFRIDYLDRRSFGNRSTGRCRPQSANQDRQQLHLRRLPQQPPTGRTFTQRPDGRDCRFARKARRSAGSAEPVQLCLLDLPLQRRPHSLQSLERLQEYHRQQAARQCLHSARREKDRPVKLSDIRHLQQHLLP